MRIAERTPLGESLYECDQCHLVGEGGSAIILQENGWHLCFSCWYEKEYRRPHGENLGLVEI